MKPANKYFITVLAAICVTATLVCVALMNNTVLDNRELSERRFRVVIDKLTILQSRIAPETIDQEKIDGTTNN